MDLEQIRSQFPITEGWIFLDNAGAVPLPHFVTGAMRGFMDTYYREGITNHWPLLQETVADCRALFAQVIGSSPEEIALVGSTSEGMNIVANMVDFRAGDNVVVTDVEFPANLFPWLNLERKGVSVRIARVMGSGSPAEEIARLVDERTRVLAVSHVAFPTGLRLDLAQMAALAHAHRAYLVVDAVQSAGAIPLDVRHDDVDFLACSGFKWLLSPSGTGAFFCRRELLERFTPAYVSWFSVEDPYAFVPGNAFSLTADARRFMISGNINLIGYQGFRAGLRFILDLGVGRIWSLIQELQATLVGRLSALELPLISPAGQAQRGTSVNFRVPETDLLLKALRDRHVYAVQRVGGIRLSPYVYNTQHEINTVMDIVGEHVARVQGPGRRSPSPSETTL